MTATPTGTSKPNGHAPPYGEHLLSPEEVARRIGRGKERRNGDEWMTLCPCPSHDDSNPSLSVAFGDNGGLLVHCHAGCPSENVLSALKELGIFVSPSRTQRSHSFKSRRKVVARYTYCEEDGTPAYEKERLEPKSFRWRRPKPDDTGYCYDLKGVRRFPYRLPDIVASPDQDVHFAEGEKDADTLKRIGLVSTFVEEPNKTDLSCFAGRHCVIHADNDAKGENTAEKLAAALSTFAGSIRIVRYPDTPSKGDVSDWMAAGHNLNELLARCNEAEVFEKASREIPSATENVEAVVWIELTERGQPKVRSQPNIRAFLEWRGVSLARNAFTHRNEVMLDGQTVELGDTVLRQLRLEADALSLTPPQCFFNDVCFDLARQNSHHPVIEYLDPLVWDGTPRLDTWLPRYAGAKDTPYVRAVGRKHLLAGVRRVRQPGAKHDAALILEGPQGDGKSTLIRTLAGDEFFTDSPSVGADPKLMIEQTSGAWLVELAELSGIRRSDVEAVKTMISRQADRARLSYERHAVDRPRQFILFGTVNDSTYLRDATGNRRFWPVKVCVIDIPALRRDRDQLWAEAAHYEAQGECIELPEELWVEAAQEQDMRLMLDPWEEKLAPMFEGQQGAVATEDLWKILDIGTHRQDGNTGRRLADVMRRLGFNRTRLRRGRLRIYCYATENYTDAFGETKWLLQGEISLGPTEAN